jgi:hypothetical protein
MGDLLVDLYTILPLGCPLYFLGLSGKSSSVNQSLTLIQLFEYCMEGDYSRGKYNVRDPALNNISSK